MFRCRRCPCPCWPCWLAVYLSARRWRKVSNNILNYCNIQTKNFQRISIIADLIILYIIICRIIIISLSARPCRWPVGLAAVVRPCRWPCAGAGGPCRWSLVTGTAASLAASRSAVSVVSPVGRPVTGRPVTGRQSVASGWPAVAAGGVGRPVGRPCRDTSQIRPYWWRHGITKTGRRGWWGRPRIRQHTAPLPSREIFYFFIFLFFHLGVWRPVLDYWLVWRP